jgi:hypothetical protein
MYCMLVTGIYKFHPYIYIYKLSDINTIIFQSDRNKAARSNNCFPSVVSVFGCQHLLYNPWSAPSRNKILVFFGVPRNLSNHMIRQARTSDTLLVKSREMTDSLNHRPSR